MTQLHEVEEPRCRLRQYGTGEGRCRVDVVQRGGPGLKLVDGRFQADDVERDERARWRGTRAGGVVDGFRLGGRIRSHPQNGPHVDAVVPLQVEGGQNLIGGGRVGHPAGDEVDGPGHLTRRQVHDVEVVVVDPVRAAAHGLTVVGDRRSRDGGDGGIPGELRERRPVEDDEVVAVAPDKGGERGRRPPARGRRRHDHASDDRDEDRQRQPRSPAAAQLGPEDQAERVHEPFAFPGRSRWPVWPARRFTRSIHPCRLPSSSISHAKCVAPRCAYQGG